MMFLLWYFTIFPSYEGLNQNKPTAVWLIEIFEKCNVFSFWNQTLHIIIIIIIIIIRRRALLFWIHMCFMIKLLLLTLTVCYIYEWVVCRWQTLIQKTLNTSVWQHKLDCASVCDVDMNVCLCTCGQYTSFTNRTNLPFIYTETGE